MSQFPKFHGITLAGNSTIENLHVERLSVDPSPVSAGRVWFNIVQKKIKFSSLDAEGNVVVSSFSSAAELTAALTEAKTYTDNAISTLKGVAPEVLDTLGEIAAALNNDPNLYNTLVGLMTEKVNAAKEELRGTVTAAFDTLGELESAVVRIDGDATVDGSFRKAIAVASGLADSALQAEIARATKAEQDLHIVTDAISLAYQQGDSDLQAAISAETAAREAAITAEVTARNSAITAAVAAEATARDAAIAAQAGNLTSDIASLQDALNSESIARAQADTNLLNGLGDERTTREAADLVLQGNIDAEAAARAAAVTAEATARATAITAEVTARETADAALQGKIDAEATARAAADTAEAAARAAAVTAEATAREAADTALQGNIDAEATARAAADTALQGKIGTLTSLSTSSKTDLVSAINEVRTLAGDGTDALRTTLNARVKRYVSPTAALTHTFNHGMNAEVVSVSVMVEGADGKFRNDFVAIEETNSNTVTVGLTEAGRIKLVVRNEADL